MDTLRLKFVKIASNAPGKCCDLYPPMGVFLVSETDKGLKVYDRDASWIPAEFDVKELPPDTKLKLCSSCGVTYEVTESFLDPQQSGESEMCLVCYEKRYTGPARYKYREVLREQIIKELEAKNNVRLR